MVAMKGRKAKIDRLVEAVLEGEALPSGRLDDPEDSEELRAAIALRAARPGADLPSEEFVTRLRQELQDDGDSGEKGRRLSRRALIAAAGVAAGGIAGATIDHALVGSGGSPNRPTQTAIVPDQTEWVAVASAAEVANGRATRFATPRLIGFVSEHGGEVVAVSGVCTHQGCLLQPNNVAGRLDCPCHRTAFGLDGRVLFSQLKDQPAPLPTLTTRRNGDTVEVQVPRQA
jgi:nitrite reductase/ring-hydroxylating ferredoxin subunit